MVICSVSLEATFWTDNQRRKHNAKRVHVMNTSCLKLSYIVAIVLYRRYCTSRSTVWPPLRSAQLALWRPQPWVLIRWPVRLLYSLRPVRLDVAFENTPDNVISQAGGEDIHPAMFRPLWSGRCSRIR